MAIDERARHELHRKLEEVLGSEEAATLMSHLPPVGWADVATKHDLAQLEERMSLRFQSMEDRFDGRLARLEGRIDQLRGEMFDRMAQQSDRFLRATVLSIFGSVLSVASLMFGARLI
jgi:hypothetical protein